MYVNAQNKFYFHIFIFDSVFAQQHAKAVLWNWNDRMTFGIFNKYLKPEKNTKPFL